MPKLWIRSLRTDSRSLWGWWCLSASQEDTSATRSPDYPHGYAESTGESCSVRKPAERRQMRGLQISLSLSGSVWGCLVFHVVDPSPQPLVAVLGGDKSVIGAQQALG